jgi:hypothetical protein
MPANLRGGRSARAKLERVLAGSQSAEEAGAMELAALEEQADLAEGYD